MLALSITLAVLAIALVVRTVKQYSRSLLSTVLVPVALWLVTLRSVTLVQFAPLQLQRFVPRDYFLWLWESGGIPSCGNLLPRQ
jgi:hypothetical protein